MDTEYSLEDLPGAMDDRNEWREPGKSMLAAQFDDECLFEFKVFLLD